MGTTTGSFESGTTEWYDLIYNYLDLENQRGINGYDVYTDEVADADYLYSKDSRLFISVDTPTTFLTFPAGGDTGVSFAVTYSGTSIFRGRTFAEQPGSNAVRLRGGFSITRVNVNLTATKPDGFPAGAYTGYATVRCE